MQDNALKNLEINCDNTKEYSRRSGIRIHGVEYNKNDDVNVINTVERA